MADGDIKDLLQQVTKQLGDTTDKLTFKAEETFKEVKAYGKLTEDTKTEVDKLATEQTALSGQVEALKAQLGEVEQKAERRGAPANQVRQSIGEQLVASDKIAPWAKSLQGGQRLNIGVTNTLLSSGVAGGVVEPQRLPGIDVMPKQRLFIRDLIAGGKTKAPAIFWVQQTGFVNNARVVSEGEKKPYSGITFGTKITPVATIAHMFKASKQILDDFDQLQSTVDVELRYGLKYEEEQEILFGAGDIHLEGLVPNAQDFDPAFQVEAQSHIDDLRLAMLQSQLARLPASGFVLHFIDWARIELTKDGSGRYILANPQSLTGPTLWGLPVVATEVDEFQGEFLTGPFSSGAQIFDREDANVVISTENADDFERNMISIRCEERLAMANKRPEGFVTGQFSSTT